MNLEQATIVQKEEPKNILKREKIDIEFLM